ncbi:MAG TPA: dihydroorotase [Bacteroidales bacterium]|nr:dihydroorotase [Bacteroidales bacterium]
MKTLIKNALVINESEKHKKSVLIEDKIIKEIYDIGAVLPQADLIIDAEGMWLLPGVIDDQVHFREPGNTYKADIFSESRAAAAGGITSFMELPNTNPPTITNNLLREKCVIAENNSIINYAFYLGATNDNIVEIMNLEKGSVAGVKIFLGSSTGNLLVDDKKSIEDILMLSPVIIAAHCEDDGIINKNLEVFKKKYNDDIPIKFHPQIRSEEACYKSSSEIVKMAERVEAPLHIFHISTRKELELLSNKPLNKKNITAEVCVHHLWFNDSDYDRLGTKIKWNPAIKKESDRQALIKALKEGKIDVVATDHAPHSKEEKSQVYTKAPSGAPMVQHSLVVMMELAIQGYFEPEDIVKWMCHNPAALFKVEKRGYIRKNYYADLVLVDPNKKTKVLKENLLYKCGWSPLEGEEFTTSVHSTFVNGEIVYKNGTIVETKAAMPLKFVR